ncbi:transcriptional regulator [Auriculariales sp. MPI-PUGE-AT-0066]|nr:transcriptional regulator [Auriculariales sp. MPI-PUGE-AT-0066]
MSQPQILSFALCLFDGAQLLDYAGPMDLFGFLDNTPRHDPKQWKQFKANPNVAFDFSYIGPTSEPVQPTSGPAVIPTATYDEILSSGKQFDVILVPGGRGVRPEVIPESLLRFIKVQTPLVKYLLSVCTGSWALAQAGVLEDRRATTNKSVFLEVEGRTSTAIDWVRKARWVEDGNLWTASGVTAGIDMAVAWLEHINGPHLTLEIRSDIEYSKAEQDSDEWAAFYGLVSKMQ